MSGKISSRSLRVFAGETVKFEAWPLVTTRHGVPEDTWWNFSYSPLRDETGAIAGMLNVPVDDTRRFHAEKALRESEERFRALATTGANMLYRMSPDWRIMYQLDGRDVLSDTVAPIKDWADLYLLPEDRPHFAVIDVAIKNRSMFELEHRVRQGDGGVGWVLSRAVPILDEAGAITAWFGAGSDITERKRADAALRDREAKLARVQRIGQVGGIDIDVAGGMRGRRSPEYLRLHGLPQETAEEAHSGWRERLHPDDRHRAEKVLFAALKSNAATYENEYRIVRACDGEVRWIQARADIERDDAGKAVRLVGAHVDITERKRAEGALRESEERQAYLLELNDALRSLSDPEEIQGVAMQLLGQRLGVSRAQYYTADETGEYLSSSGGYTDGVPAAVGRFRLIEFGKYAYDGFHAGETQVVSDARIDPASVRLF